MADRTIQIIIDTRDRATGSVKAIAESLLKLDQTAQRLANRFKSFSTSKYMATLALIDRVTEPASRINSLLKRIAGGAWRVSLSLSDGALAGVRKIESALMRLTNRVYNIKTGVSGGMNNLTSGLMMGAGVFAPVAGMAGVGFGVSNAISAYAGFEKQMSRVQAIRQLDKNSAEMQAIVQQAKDLGATTAWTRQQVGEAQEYQALAGWKTEQILAATPHMLNLATAAGTDLGRASDIVTDTMTAFGLNATETYKNKQGQLVSVTEGYIDMMSKIQAISNTNVEQAGEALKYAAPVLGTIGRGKSAEDRMQIAEDALIMTGLMADAGIKGSMAGTSLRAVFSRFAGGQRNALFSLKGLGVEVKNGSEMLMPGEIMRQLRQRVNEGVDPNQLLAVAEEFAGEKIHADTRRKLDSFIENTLANGGKIGSAELMKMATMLGGQEAMSGLLAIMSGDWDAKAAEMDRAAGTAKEMADIMLDNLAGSFTILGSAWDNFQQNLMEGKAGDGLRDFVNTLTDVINRADKLFSDGIQIGDFGNLIGDVIDRLKKKFLEFDGIGSVLAGGALIAGLTKIFTTAQKTLGVLRGVQSGTSSVGGAAAAKVGTMNVSAGVVNVNGKVGGAGGRKVGDQRIIDRYNREKERANARAALVSNAKTGAAGGAAFAAVFSAMDILAVRTQNAERLAQAAPEERAQVIKENRALELETNSGALGSIVGAALGAGLGSMAGPMGTAIGGVVGGMIGDALGRIVAQHFGDNEGEQPAQNYFNEGKVPTVREKVLAAYEENSQTTRRRLGAAHSLGESNATLQSQQLFNKIDEKLGAFSPFQFDAQLTAAQNYYQQQRERMMTSPQDFYGTQENFSHAHASELNAEQMAQMAAMERGEFYATPTEIIPPDTSALDEFCAAVEEKLGALQEGADEIFTGLGETLGAGLTAAQATATGSLETIQTSFTTAKETICAAWGELPGFFEGVFSGLGGAAASAGSAIYSGLTSVIDGVIGAWSSAAATVSGIISSIAAAGSSVGATVSGVIARVRGHAEGGLITAPELAVVGEKGPELILPLNDPARTNELLQQTFGDTTPQNISVDNSGGSGINLTLNANFNVSGDENVLRTIQEHMQELADKFAAQLSSSVGASFNNRAVGV